MRNNTIQFIFACALMLMNWSCSSENSIADIPIDGEQDLEFSLQIKEHQAMSRATELLDDSRDEIESIQLFFFRGESLIWKAPIIRTDIIQNKNQATFKVKIPLEVSEVMKGISPLVYAVINSADIDEESIARSLSNLRGIEVETPNLNQATAPKYLMTGDLQLTSPLSFNENETTKLEKPIVVKRAAAKIQLELGSINVKENGRELQAEGVQAKLVQYTTQTTLDELKTNASKLQTTDYRELSKPDKTWNSTTFFSYENDWTINEDAKTYLLLKVRFETIDKDYYYRIPVYYESEQQIKRNTGYKVNVNIHRLGTEDESEPLEMKGQVRLCAFTEVPIDVNLIEEHYLFVKDKYPEFLYTIEKQVAVEYISSSKDITWEVIEEYYCNSDGDKMFITQGGNVAKSVNIGLKSKNNKTYLYFTLKKAMQFVPQYVKLKLINIDGKAFDFIFLSLYDYYSFISHETKNNQRLIEVKMTVTDGNKIGYAIDGKGYTLLDEKSNKFVSPDFYLAPEAFYFQRQNRATWKDSNGNTYNNYSMSKALEKAKEHCNKYSVTLKDGTILGGINDNNKWRIPTSSELTRVGYAYIKTDFFPREYFNNFHITAYAHNGYYQSSGIVQYIRGEYKKTEKLHDDYSIYINNGFNTLNIHNKPIIGGSLKQLNLRCIYDKK